MRNHFQPVLRKIAFQPPTPQPTLHLFKVIGPPIRLTLKLLDIYILENDRNQPNLIFFQSESIENCWN